MIDTSKIKPGDTITVEMVVGSVSLTTGRILSVETSPEERTLGTYIEPKYVTKITPAPMQIKIGQQFRINTDGVVYIVLAFDDRRVAFTWNSSAGLQSASTDLSLFRQHLGEPYNDDLRGV